MAAHRCVRIGKHGRFVKKGGRKVCFKIIRKRELTHADIQTMIRRYVRKHGLGHYVANSATPKGGGVWQFYTRRPGEKPVRHEVSHATLAGR